MIEWNEMRENDSDDFLDEGCLQSERLEEAKQIALKMISVKMHTQQELWKKLQKKGYPKEYIQEIIHFLESYGYLDDEAYCRSWIHDRIHFHPCGRKKMEFELAKKIRNRQLIQQSLENCFSAEQEVELAVAAAVKKINGSRFGSNREQLSRFLYSKGYSGSVIQQVLQQKMIQQKMEDGQEKSN